MSAPHIFLVAGEESGDRLGAALMAALKERTQGNVRFSGLGGAHMSEHGLSSLFKIGELPTIGFSKLPFQLTKILRRIRDVADAAIAAKPDVLVIIDNPEFTHRVARRVREHAPSIPIVDYVCPSVWAWRPGRARAMRGYIDHVLALLPFEPAVMQKLGGPPCSYVGHPLSERVEELRPAAGDAHRRLADPPLLLVLPGSRRTEIGRMTKVFGGAVAQVAARIPGLEVIVPAVPRLAEVAAAAAAKWGVPVRVVTEPAEKYAAYRRARAALSKSGTSTLELAIAGVPMVAGYKVSFLEGMAGRWLIKGITSVLLPNLILGENVIPEFLQEHCTVGSLTGALLPLMSDTPERHRQVDAFGHLDVIMEFGAITPSQRAGAIVLDHARLNQAPR